MKKPTNLDRNSNKAEQTKPTLQALFSHRHFRLHLSAFILVNILLYIWITAAHGLIKFDRHDYIVNARHFVADSRITSPNSFNLITSLGPYDAQYYLKISVSGYPSRAYNKKVTGGGLSYAFPPAYPFLISITNTLTSSVAMSAFITTQLTLVLGFTLVYWLVCRWYNKDLAAKTSWLVFLYPFSIFYRGYFAEGLFLILLVVAMDALRSKKWFEASLATGLLAVTRLIGLAGVILSVYLSFVEFRNKRLKLSKLLQISVVAILPIVLFSAYSAIKTGNPFYFIIIRGAWAGHMPAPLATFWSFFHIFSARWHYFHSSRIDLFSIALSGSLVYLSRRWLPPVWWYFALMLWTIPLLTNDTMSASRYQIVNLPLYIYVANVLSARWYRIVIGVSTVGLLLVSIMFVNWVWVG